jgi:Arc/MetJ-type ribon-helix-helix transcriptional regulator
MTNASKNTKKRGRPQVDSEPITLRLPSDLMASLDEWREGQPIPPKRADVVRFALVEWLKTKGKTHVQRT